MPLNKMIQRSPVRIFEKVIGGGLGAGNMGVVLSRRGVGKTGFLIGLAVDNLLQGKKVLYISTKESVDHISTFSSLFAGIACQPGNFFPIKISLLPRIVPSGAVFECPV